MGFTTIHLQEKVKLLSDMILCCHNLYYTIYSSDFQTLIFKNYPNELSIDLLFRNSEDWSNVELSKEAPNYPILYSTDFEISWIMVPYPNDDSVHVLGPFFMTDMSQKELAKLLNKRNFSIPIKRQFEAIFKELPVISMNRILEYTLMQYFCLFDEKIAIDSICYRSSHSDSKVNQEPSLKKSPSEKSDHETIHHGTYEAEQKLLQMVREGNLNYRSHMNKLAMTGNLGKLSNDNPLRQAKNAIFVAITLFSRAAIDGGLNPDISYTLTDHYFQSTEACDNLSELADIMHAMQDDFIQRVHACRNTTEYSIPVRSCIEYLDYHIEDEIDWDKLAASLGYNIYYFSKKFKRETGLSPKDYLLNKRFEYSKFLLNKTNSPVSEISAKLQFCSQSYYTEQFKKRFGMTPKAYRDDPLNLLPLVQPPSQSTSTPVR